MLRQEIEKQVIETIKKELVFRKKTDITLDTSLREDLDLTSFDIAEVCANLEQVYGIDIVLPTEHIDTVQQLCDKVYSIVDTKHKIQPTNNIDNTAILQKIRVLIKDYCENNPDDYRSHQINQPINLETKLKKRPLKLDDTDIMQLAMNIEKEFGIDLPQHYIDGFATIEDIVRGVHFWLIQKERQKYSQTIQKQR